MLCEGYNQIVMLKERKCDELGEGKDDFGLRGVSGTCFFLVK